MTFFSIDGIDWQVPCTINRVSEVTDSEISGRLLDKNYFNDVIGVYLKYDISIAVPFGMEDDYTEIYEKLTEPVGHHAFVLPYNDDYVQITGRVERVKDTFVRIPGQQHYWRGTGFTVISNNPTKTMSLSQVLAAGMPVYPSQAHVAVGSLWQYTANGWETYEPTVYADYDSTEF